MFHSAHCTVHAFNSIISAWHTNNLRWWLPKSGNADPDPLDPFQRLDPDFDHMIRGQYHCQNKAVLRKFTTKKSHCLHTFNCGRAEKTCIKRGYS